MLSGGGAVVESGNGFYQFSIHGSLSAIHYSLLTIVIPFSLGYLCRYEYLTRKYPTIP
jgi:hypothetical protein